jgi:hypothetical protein
VSQTDRLTHIHTERRALTVAQVDALRVTHGDPDTCRNCKPVQLGMTQAARLLAYLRARPGASSLEITDDLRIPNVTGRISDLRAQGIDIVCVKERGVSRYRIVEPAQASLPW